MKQRKTVSDFLLLPSRYKLDPNIKCVIAELGEPDVVLIGFDRHWPCHRSVLSQSDFFRTLLNAPFMESSLSEIKLHADDYLITEKSFEKLLDLMYEREIDLQQDEVFHLIVTAQYFQMNNVVEFCESKIMQMVRMSNSIDIFHFADRYFLERLRTFVFQWMLLHLFPVKCWDQLNYLSVELAEKLIRHPRLIVPNEMYLYHVCKILVQYQINATCAEENEKFYGEIRQHPLPFLLRKEGKQFSKAFDALRLQNIVVRRENVEVIIRDNIVPRSMVEACVFSNWMSLISIETPENFGPTSELISQQDFETNAMRFSKVIEKPDYHSWKFIGFSFAFDMAIFFDGRTLIVKRVHQINEHKISHSHLLRRIMIRYNITEVNTLDVRMKQEEIQTLTMTTNEEVCLKQLQKEPKYPCRISIEVLFHVPYKSIDGDKTMIDRVNVSNTSILKSNSIPSKAFQAYKRFFS
jgi:hypothetical protein